MDTPRARLTPLSQSNSILPHILTGALIGLLLTVPLVIIFYVGDALFGLPFVPFDVLDWMARNLPGGLLTFGIDTMVSVIRTFQLGETSSTAKLGEHTMAITGMIVTGVVAGAAYFGVLSRRSSSPLIPGLILGLIVGVPVALMSRAANFTATADPIISFLWIIGAFLAWGAAFAWAYTRLNGKKYLTDGSYTAEVAGIDRRSFLIRVGGAAATITVVGAGLGTLFNTQKTQTVTVQDTPPQPQNPASNLPNAADPLVPAPGTRPEYTPVEDHYRIDISSRPPLIDGETYKLPIHGLVDNPLDLSLSDIQNSYESIEQYVTLACISNQLGGDLTSTTKWTGVSFQKLLADAQLQPDARYLRITSADGFDETVDINLINQDERIMLTYLWDDQPLPQRNGFPLRIYIPDRYGMKQPKWITDIEVVAEYQEGYWVRRGWDEVARMNTTSVIDTVAVDSVYEADGQMFVPVGGIAHAGARGISKVEVKVDDGEWIEADLRAPLSETTWVIWRYDWPFAEGDHTFYVRAYEGDGALQVETFAPVRPSGATGIHSRSASLEAPTEA